MGTSCFSVVVPQDANPFTVDRQQMVRLTAEGIAGAKIVADVDGPAELVAENSIMTVKDGHVLIGMEKKEFVIRPTGQGKVTVEITTTFLKNEPTVTNYEFEVK
jgi:hypothetical protein